MKEMQIFTYHKSRIRTFMIDGEPWFVAKDVCDILDLGNPSQALSRLDEDEKNTIILNEGIGNPEKAIVNEAGLYSLILGSKKPEAKQFKRWITHEVIPTIRKTGGYGLPAAIDSKFLYQIAQTLEEKELKIAELTPKAEFFDAVADSKDAIDMGSAAKVLNIGIGRTKLFKFLRDKGVLMENNQPYQEFCDRGYFRTIEQKYTIPDGSTHVNIKRLCIRKDLTIYADFMTKQKLYKKKPIRQATSFRHKPIKS